jgi:hypothetical protein
MDNQLTSADDSSGSAQSGMTAQSFHRFIDGDYYSGRGCGVVARDVFRLSIQVRERHA